MSEIKENQMCLHEKGCKNIQEGTKVITVMRHDGLPDPVPEDEVPVPDQGFTHAGTFHADDVFSTALLRILNQGEPGPG